MPSDPPAADSIGEMTDVTSSTEPESVEPTPTAIGSPEHVYVAIVVTPNAGNQIVTAHRSRDGADAQLDELAATWEISRDLLEAEILELPLLA